MSFIFTKKFLLTIILLLVGSSLLIYAATEKEETTDKTLLQNQEIKASNYLGKDWVLTSYKGNRVNLSDYQGQPVLLIFWATWCPYCKKLLPGIAELNEKYQSKGLKIIAVNILDDWKPKVYWRNFGYTFDMVLEGDDVAKIYGIQELQVSYLLHLMVKCSVFNLFLILIILY